MTPTPRYRAGRWAIIAGIALSAPWIVSRRERASVSPVPTIQVPAFRIGEILNYRIDWQRYSGAGVAQLQVVDRGNFYGSEMWHFRATLRTAEPVRALYPMQDEIDSFALLGALESRQYQEHFREFGKPENTDVALVPPGQASLAPAPRVIVPPNTHDVLSAIYLLRAMDWRAEQQLRVPVFDGENVYEMVAKRGGRTAVQIAAGSYSATAIEIRLFDKGREIPDDNFTIWLADDAAQTPVRCEARLSFGALRIELSSPASANQN